MLENKMVRLRFRKDLPSQPIWVFIGKVVHFSQSWVGVEGKGILVYRRDTYASERRTLKGNTMVEEPWTEISFKLGAIDEEVRTMVFPRDAIANIRVLPDGFNLDSIRLRMKGRRIDVVVDNGPSTSIGEMMDE